MNNPNHVANNLLESIVSGMKELQDLDLSAPHVQEELRTIDRAVFDLIYALEDPVEESR